MLRDEDTEEPERALPPPGNEEIAIPMWFCPVCEYMTPGTIDEPYAGDGTCMRHPQEQLRLRRSGDTPTGSGPAR